MLSTGASSQSPVLCLRFGNDSDERMKHDDVWRRMKWREEYGLDRRQSMIINCVWKHNIGVCIKSPYVFFLPYIIIYQLPIATLYRFIFGSHESNLDHVWIHPPYYSFFQHNYMYTTNKHYTCTISSRNSTLPPSWKVETTWIFLSTKCNNLIQCVLGWWWRIWWISLWWDM